MRLAAVNVGTPTLLGEINGDRVWSGIGKHPVSADGRLWLSWLNLSGDGQAEENVPRKRPPEDPTIDLTVDGNAIARHSRCNEWAALPDSSTSTLIHRLKVRRNVMDRPRVFAGTVPPPDSRAVPSPGQESVWDYPRPPRVEPVPERIRIVVGGTTLADTTRAYRVLETAGAPVYCVPPADVRGDLLVPTEHRSVCEWKGDASYWSIVLPDRTIPNAAWSYPDPLAGY